MTKDVFCTGGYVLLPEDMGQAGYCRDSFCIVLAGARVAGDEGAAG